MRYMLATGQPSGSGVRTEIVDLSDPSKSCLLEDISYRFYSAGGLLESNPIICGGHDGNDWLNECLLYGTSQEIYMNSKRTGHSLVALNDSEIWVTGGSYGNRLDTTEFITAHGAVNGPTLPEAVEFHCTVKFAENVYLIGGDTNYGATNNVWVANPSNGHIFLQGPSLITKRYHHGCGTMSIGAKSIIVAAGGCCNYLSSVEILDPLSNQWVAGK